MKKFSIFAIALAGIICATALQAHARSCISFSLNLNQPVVCEPVLPPPCVYTEYYYPSPVFVPVVRGYYPCYPQCYQRQVMVPQPRPFFQPCY